MDSRRTELDIKFLCFIMLIGIQGSYGLLNSEGPSLLEFPNREGYDQYSVINELGDILNLKHQHSSNSDLSGRILDELAGMQSLKQHLHSSSHTKLDKIACAHRKFGCRRSWLQQTERPESFSSSINEKNRLFFSSMQLLEFGSGSSHTSESRPKIQAIETEIRLLRRRLLQDSSNRNLAAAPAPSSPPPDQGAAASPMMHGSGALPVVPLKSKKQPYSPVPSPHPGADANGSPPTITGQSSSDQQSVERIKKYLLIASCATLLFIIAAIMISMCQSKAVVTIGPRKTGISGQLQKAFVTGVPNLNRSELEIACEEFSNIIDNHGGCIIYKGILSSGVEIAVISASVASEKEWSSHSENYFGKKIETLSRVNHKNFINLIGYCEENDPFTRMMVFEYVPNGTLSEHLHVKDAEHLDWNTRMRIIMGTAYCLQYMHDLTPPVAVTNFTSADVYLTDDYAAKIADTSSWANFMTKSKADEDPEDIPLLPPVADPETNVYSFGILLLEVISGQHPISKDGGSVVNWASEYLKTRENINAIVDPTLKSFKNNELETICDVIQDCLEQDPTKRPSMTEVITKLRQAIAITPDTAIPNISPLWWAELEILSLEAS